MKQMTPQSGSRTKSTFLSHNDDDDEDNYYDYWNALEQGTEPPTAPAELLSGWQHVANMAGKSQVCVCVRASVCELYFICRLWIQMWFKGRVKRKHGESASVSQQHSNSWITFFPPTCQRSSCSLLPVQCKSFWAHAALASELQLICV